MGRKKITQKLEALDYRKVQSSHIWKYVERFQLFYKYYRKRTVLHLANTCKNQSIAYWSPIIMSFSWFNVNFYQQTYLNVFFIKNLMSRHPDFGPDLATSLSLYVRRLLLVNWGGSSIEVYFLLMYYTKKIIFSIFE